VGSRKIKASRVSAKLFYFFGNATVMQPRSKLF